MAVSKQPSITPETSSGEGLDEEPSSRGEAKWKRFHPFRVVRKIFRRRVKREGTTVVSDASKKSWSTSELQSVQDDGAGKCEVTSPLKIGLSVSHDSIFSPENNTNAANSEELNVPRGSSLSVRHTSIKNMFKDELFTRVRARRDSEDDDDDEDIGLPHSPCTSPTTADVLAQGLKEKSSKSQTTCSAGSLISMGSSENDEDSAGQSSGHSSRMSLLDRRSLDSEGDPDLSQPVPLNHNAAHHKIAVRPKRTYNLPRRRMNQIAASKVNTLPSTPEVTEDNGRVFQKFEAMEEIKTSSEQLISTVSESLSTSVLSTEKQTSSYMTSSFSFNEISRKSNEALLQQTKERSPAENAMQMTAKDDSKANIQEITKKFDINSCFKDVQEPRNEDSFKMHESDEIANKNAADIFGDLKDNLGKNKDDVIESVKLLKSSLQESAKCELTHVDDSALKQTETSVSVSSLVKSIERADSFKSANKVKKPLGENKPCVKGLVHMQGDFIFEEKGDNDFAQGTINVKSENEMKGENKLTPHTFGNRNNEISNFEKSDEHRASRDSIGEPVKKSPLSEVLDIDSEFILKPPRKLENDSSSALKDASSDKQKENSLISSLYFEEESIMSNKSVSMGIEESRIFISHHASDNDDLKDILVTEAHNFSAIEEKVGVSVQTSSERLTEIKKENSEPYISSVGISTSTPTTTDVTVNSSTSTLCDSRMMEDKITISVNSKPDAKSKASDKSKEDAKQTTLEFKKSTPNANVSQKNLVKENQTGKQGQKSHLPDVNSSVAALKNSSSQKRVSVEIVPFSQRMKERKYQPISFNNKESSTDMNKKGSNVSVERKLSDRKVTAKNKELEKSNNRHSFSGALSTESKKESDVVGKKVTKPEKLQYPVQIRIHKSAPKPEGKDKLGNDMHNNKDIKNLPHKDAPNDVKFQMHSAKLSQTEAKFPKEDKRVSENTSKWEIKIQPSVGHTPVSSHHAEHEDSNSTLASQTTSLVKNEPHKSQIHGSESKDLHLSQDSGSSLVKSQENNWRPVKETAPILADDPEPELLRVFARRSIKQKHCDKGKTDENEEKLLNDSSSNHSLLSEKSEENNEMISISHNSTVIKISEISKPHISKPDLKKKSKSFCEKEKTVPRSISPLKEMNLIRRESPTKHLSIDPSVCNETVHPRQRLVNVSDVPVTLPPDTDRKNMIRSSQNESSTESSPAPSVKEEHLHRAGSISSPSPTTSVNGSLTGLGMVKENQEIFSGKEAHAPSWLQLAQQRRELREQRERLLLGGSPNSFMDASNKPSRSSKVWDMVNNFQKLQMT